MSVSAKPNPLQTYQLILYSRALHPSHFRLQGRQVISEGRYELEAWVMPGQHALRFEHKGMCCTEYVTDQDRGIPTGGIITQHLCASEKDYEHVFAKDGVLYLSTCQTETLPDATYASTYEEMLALGRENNALVHPWEDDTGRCLSMVDMQRLSNQVHMQCYHMVAGAGLVLKTLSLFEVIEGGARQVEVKPSGVNGSVAGRPGRR